MNFYYKYRTLREAFHYEPEAHWPKELVWRVAYGITPAEWAAYLPPGCRWESGKLITLPGPYSLVREDVWHRFREAVRQSGDEYLQERVLALWLNPSQRRPGFLYEKHQSGADEGSSRPAPVNIRAELTCAKRAAVVCLSSECSLRAGKKYKEGLVV